jgi:hypothetical protein
MAECPTCNGNVAGSIPVFGSKPLTSGSIPSWSAGRARLTLNQDKRRRFDSYLGSPAQHRPPKERT